MQIEVNPYSPPSPTGKGSGRMVRELYSSQAIAVGHPLHLFQGDTEIRLRPKQGRHVVGDTRTPPSR